MQLKPNFGRKTLDDDRLSAEKYLIFKESLDQITPPRQWVGLTDEEIDEIHGSPMRLEHSGLMSFVRAIEAKLREKNDG